MPDPEYGEPGRHGRLEVLLGGRWGTVCDEGFSNEDAEVRVGCDPRGFDVGTGLEAALSKLAESGAIACFPLLGAGPCQLMMKRCRPAPQT